MSASAAKARRVAVPATPLFDPPPDPWAGAEGFIDSTAFAKPPRHYQRSAFLALCGGISNGLCSETYVLPTGTGKTVTFSYMIRYVTEVLGWRVLVVAHLGELLTQAQKTLRGLGIESVVEKADQDARKAIEDARASLVDRRDIRVVLGSRQTMFGRRLKLWDRDYFDLIVVDECHHTPAESYMNIIGWFRKAVLVGATATDYRGDGLDLYDVYQERVYEYPVWKALEEGFLAKPLQRKAPVQIDLKGVKINAGDFQAGDLATRVTEQLNPIANAILECLPGRKILAFVPNVATVYALADILSHIGVTAIGVDGQNPNRELIAKRFERGEFRCLVNCGLYLEGYDDPSIDAIVLARPTKSRGLLSQMAGRGLRPGKENCILLDFAWLLDKHDIASYAEVMARPDDTPEAIKLARKRMDETGEEDFRVALDEAKLELKKLDEEKAARPETRLNVKGRVNPTMLEFKDFEVVMSQSGKYELAGTHQWRSSDIPLTSRQAEMLTRFRVPRQVSESLSRRAAEGLITTLQERSRAKMSSYGQVQFLLNRGYQREAAMAMTHGDASDVMDRLIGKRKKKPAKAKK